MIVHTCNTNFCVKKQQQTKRKLEVTLISFEIPRQTRILLGWTSVKF